VAGDLTHLALQLVALQRLVVALRQAKDRLPVFEARPVTIDWLADAGGQQEAIPGHLGQGLAGAPDIAVDSFGHLKGRALETWIFIVQEQELELDRCVDSLFEQVLNRWIYH